MQVKPCFEKYKVLKQTFILQDDLFNNFYLTELEIYPKPLGNFELIITPYTLLRVLGKIENYNNGVVAFSSVAYFKDKKRLENNYNIDSILVKEIKKETGSFMFTNYNTEIQRLFDENGKYIESEQEFKQRWANLKEKEGSAFEFKIYKQ
jgi:hypothetical protein